MAKMTSLHERAQGVLYGQIIGDSLGSLVEFQGAEAIRAKYPEGVRELADGGHLQLTAGQPTDDSEMALALARSLVEEGSFCQDTVHEAYRRWARSHPFDIGNTCANALRNDDFNPDSQANGALMRISPLAVAYHRNPGMAARLALVDGHFTHIAALTDEANAFYVTALAEVVAGKDAKQAVQDNLRLYPHELDGSLPDVSRSIGWVDHAVRLVDWAVAADLGFEESLVKVVGLGGDSDTNAAIVGAFLGGAYGVNAIPQRWRTVVDNCQPAHDRPAEYNPCDVAQLAIRLADLLG